MLYTDILTPNNNNFNFIYLLKAAAFLVHKWQLPLWIKFGITGTSSWFHCEKPWIHLKGQTISQSNLNKKKRRNALTSLVRGHRIAFLFLNPIDSGWQSWNVHFNRVNSSANVYTVFVPAWPPRMVGRYWLAAVQKDVITWLSKALLAWSYASCDPCLESLAYLKSGLFCCECLEKYWDFQ